MTALADELDSFATDILRRCVEALRGLPSGFPEAAANLLEVFGGRGVRLLQLAAAELRALQLHAGEASTPASSASSGEAWEVFHQGRGASGFYDDDDDDVTSSPRRTPQGAGLPRSFWLFARRRLRRWHARGRQPFSPARVEASDLARALKQKTAGTA